MTGNNLLEGLLILDLSQFLAGPYASLRLQDLGARVIKIERPDGGDLTRSLYLSDTMIDGESTIFHAINRGKESLALDLKEERDKSYLRKLICKADVVIQNFRPGVIERLGFDYETVRKYAPHIVYGSVSGYGPQGPWDHFPGQDLLAQARSGAMWLNGSDGDGPVPFGLAVADMFAGANMAQGLLAALVRRGMTGEGAHIETSLLEAMVDFQFEVLATHLNDGNRPPKRSSFRSAHVGLSAPYGVYPTKDGYLAIAMAPVDQMHELLNVTELKPYAENPDTWFAKRDEIKTHLAKHLTTQTTQHWLSILEPHDVWCSKVLDWTEMLSEEAFQNLDMIQKVSLSSGVDVDLIKSPIRVNGQRGKTSSAGPEVGAHTDAIINEFSLT